MSTLLSYALCSIGDVKENLGIASSITKFDNLITRQINRATDMIENYTGRRFLSSTYTNIEYDAPNTYQLVLQQRPITTLSSFQIRNTQLNDNNWEDIESDLYFVDPAAAVIDLNFKAIGRWNRYRVTYVAGYDSVPSDLAEACASLATYFTKNAESDISIREKQEGGRRVMFWQGIKGVKDLFAQLGIDGTIDSYSNEPINADK